MADKTSPAKPAAPTADPKAYRPPAGKHTTLTATIAGKRAPIDVHADWLLIREHGIPSAEVFFTSYQLPRKASASASKRPVTFLFNGGPGAASAFLHLGTAGPHRLAFGKAGAVLPPPAQIVDNAETWLAFTDLVFVDPVGTGFSRTVAESKLEQGGIDADEEKTSKATKSLSDNKKPFFKVKRDIDVLAEFVSQWLSANNRWDSPVSIAGESYGGFRVGKLIRALPERGIGLTGAIMISPAIDFLQFPGSDYEAMAWLNALPTMALAAAYHKKASGKFASLKADALRAAVESFAEEELAPILIMGERADARKRDRALSTLADLTGLPRDLIDRHGGRVPIDVFGRELLRAEGKVLGLYDAAVTGHNVFPDRTDYGSNPDPTLAGIMAGFTAAVNTILRQRIGVQTSREYITLSEEVWRGWADDRMTSYSHRQLDCADDMRYGLGMNPNLNLLICHGWFDLVTTYFSSRQAVSLLRLPEALRKQVTLTNYDGGHMFYSWESSRKAVARDARAAIAP